MGIIKNLEQKKYKGETSYYCEIDGQKAKLKGFEPSEIKEGAMIDGYLKEWEYEGKSGFIYWKSKPKQEKQESTLKQSGTMEMLAQLQDRIDKFLLIIEQRQKESNEKISKILELMKNPFIEEKEQEKEQEESEDVPF